MSDSSEIDFTSAMWSDLTPVPQDDGPAPLAAIAYHPSYSTAMSYLRAIMLAEEYSERAIDLTAEVIMMNPAHYTVWGYRFKCLLGLEGKSGKVGREWEGWEEELSWVMGVARSYEKNYQIWHHRQLIISHLGDPLNERLATAEMFRKDSKNYHVWTYRQWLVTRFSLFDPTEVAYTTTLISDDVRNNSAWNHRYFVMTKGGLLSSPAEVDAEIAYVKTAIEGAVMNASGWNYLKGVLKYAGRPLPSIREFCEGFTQEGNVTSSHALDILADIYADEKETAKALKALDMLAETYDPIRKNYWMYRKRLLGSVVGPVGA